MGDTSIVERLRCEIASIEAGGKAGAYQDEDSQGGAEGGSKKSAFAKLIALVNISDRSESALRDRLARAGFPEAEVDEAIERAKRCGIVDDLRYADVLIRSRLNQGRGAAGIERELRGQGIDVGQVAGWPFGYGIDDESEYHRALAFLESHPTRSKNKREGACRKLIQRGYSLSVAADAARAWSGR